MAGIEPLRYTVRDPDGNPIGEVFLSAATLQWGGLVTDTRRRLPHEYDTPTEAIGAVRAAVTDHQTQLAKEAALPPGPRFALAARRQYHIGPATHRHRGGVYLRDALLERIDTEVAWPSGTPDGQALAAAVDVALYYRKIILGGRYSGRLWAWLHDPTPNHLVGLLADMLDQHVTTSPASWAYFVQGTSWHRYVDTRDQDPPQPASRPAPLRHRQPTRPARPTPPRSGSGVPA